MIFLLRTLVSFDINRPKNIAILDNFLQKWTTVCQKSVSWHSNQEFRSICADTVSKLERNHAVIFWSEALYEACP